MSTPALTYRNGRIFDGQKLRTGHAVRFEDGHLAVIGPETDIAKDGESVDLQGDILSPGYVDLQVNGGDGIMFNDDPSPHTLQRIAEAHRRLGVSALLPTLITDTRATTQAAIAAAAEAIAQGVPGIAGLHLEGPHLSLARKGAHDPNLIRPMLQNDLDLLLDAAKAIPILMVTVAPEKVTEDQVTTLSQAGVLVSLGHTDASYETCRRYFAAGARYATHLFNAMSQLGNREPGLVGAVLADGSVSCGLIADTIHVHPQSMQIAWSSKNGPGGIFLVSDAMAVAGTEQTSFNLGSRKITRQDGRLTLSDGALAGADLDLTTAIGNMIQKVGVTIEDALHAATTRPAALIGRPDHGLIAGRTKISDVIRISKDFQSVSALD